MRRAKNCVSPSRASRPAGSVLQRPTPSLRLRINHATHGDGCFDRVDFDLPIRCKVEQSIQVKE